MKMLKNGLEGDAFAISRIPIPSPRCTKMGEAVLPCAAPPHESPVQVHPLHHLAEDVAVAVAEPVDGVDDREKKRYKNRVLPSTVPKPCVANVETLCVANVEAPNANAHDVDVG